MCVISCSVGGAVDDLRGTSCKGHEVTSLENPFFVCVPTVLAVNQDKNREAKKDHIA